jgi:class 3 adenylate cyclase
VRGRGYAIGVPVERIAEPGEPDRTRARDASADAGGARPGAPAPRRLAALLSADMADFARHRARDAEGTGARLAALAAATSEIVARHRGLLVHFVDDNLLAVFPAAVEATRAALALRDRVARLDADRPADERFAFRIGLHLADVIEDGGRVYGGGVQVAARLERLAEPGGVCLSAAVRDQIAGRIDVGLDDLGEQRLKGVADPVRVYRLSRPAPAIDRS